MASSTMNERLPSCSQNEQCNGPSVNRITPCGSVSGSFGGGSGCPPAHCVSSHAPCDEARFFAQSRANPTANSFGNSGGNNIGTATGAAAATAANDRGSLSGNQPNMKRQRVTSPAAPAQTSANNNSEKQQQQQRTHVMPMFLCIPMLLLGLIQSTSASSNIMSGSSNLSGVGSIPAGEANVGVTSDGKLYRPNRPAAPLRPAHAPDVDYGGVHPFDKRRHLFDVDFADLQSNNGGLRSKRDRKPERKHDESRQLKKEEDEKDKDKDKDKDKEEANNVQEGEQQTERPTPSLTRPPYPSGSTSNTSDGGNGSTNEESSANSNVQTMTFEKADSSPLVFEGADTTSLNVASSTTQSANGSNDPNLPTSQTTTLDPSNDHLYQPLRIQFDSSQLAAQMDIAIDAGDSIAATKLYLLIYEILPMTAQVWGDILRVIPVSGGIYPLAAQGSGVDQLLPNKHSNENDATIGEDAKGYYDDPVRLQYCPDETTSGIEGGADLLVYATVNRHCPSNSNGGNNSDGGGTATLASALSCQRDQYDRPITGSIDFCLEGMRGTAQMNVAANIRVKVANGVTTSVTNMVGSEGASSSWDGWNGVTKGTDGVTTVGGVTVDNRTELQKNRETIQYAVGVAIHEIGHVLGVTSDSLAYFRHPLTGHPLTRRPFELATVTCVNGESMAYIGMPGPHVMQEGRHEATSGNRYFEVVTPTVQRVVRNHFNCPRMKGARLENQPTSTDCFGSHWDEMLYYTEIMGAVLSRGVNILSPLTLAYLEDSGWYRANYQSDYVQISVFGHGAGCDFLETNCIDSEGNVPEVFEEQFCNTPISIQAGGLIDPAQSGPQTCDPSHTQKTYCDLVNTNEVVAIGNKGKTMEPAPPHFQYFEQQPNLRPYVLTNADYCPIPHLDPQSCLEASGNRAVTNEQKLVGETYGPNSRCVETDGTRSYSLCLQRRCNARLGKVQIMAGDQWKTCNYDGQTHEVAYNDDGSGGEVRIKCPKAALICPELFCPANCAGRGVCTYDSDRTEDDDDEWDTPLLAKCVCDSVDDTTEGCYSTKLSVPAVYGYAYENPNAANKTLFMVIVGSLVAGLALMFIAVRQWKAKQNVFM